MSIVSDPTRYFVFKYPEGFLTYGTFSYIHSSPYLISTEWSLYFKIPRFCLPYNYHSEPVYREGVEDSIEKALGLPIPDEYILEYEHTLVDMTEFDVNTAFVKRAIEYYNYDMNNDSCVIYEYLDFHYSEYHYELNDWLEYVSKVFKDIKKYIKIPQLSALRVRALVNGWIDVKRNELAKLEGKTEVVDETTELDAELEKKITGHKVVLLHELGVIEHLQKLCKEKNPTMSHTKFAELVGLILGLQSKKSETVRKCISGYGQGTKDDPKTSNALTTVKSKLLKFGIEL